MRIVLVSGKAGAGKDTIARFLVKRGYTRFAFADTLKHRVSEQYGIHLDVFHTHAGKSSLLETGGTARDLLISEATHQRTIDPDIWANLVIKQIQSQTSQKVVISDFRFTNEQTRLQDIFGKSSVTTVRVERAEDVSERAEDVSERALDHHLFDHILQNNGGLDDLEMKVSQINL